jgi:hypothetical protein
MRTVNIVFLVVCAEVCLSAATPAAELQSFDVCDVSFLIPPSARSIPVAGGDRQRSLLSRELFLNFEDFIKRGHPQLTADEIYGNLVVTGIRFDPCGPKYPDDWDLRKCVLPNLRVIAQVYMNGRPTNAALHMVFLLRPLSDLVVVDGRIQPNVRLDAGMRDDVISRLASMKSKNTASGISTNGVPAGVHPVFGHRNRDSVRVAEFEAELKSLLEEYCVENRYFFTAVMFTDEEYATDNPGKERWVWQKANIDHSSGKIVFRFGGIPGFDPKLKEQSFTADRGRRTAGTVLPPSTLPENGVRNTAMEAILKNADQIDQSLLSEAIDATDRLENPDRVLVQTDDCASCHVTTTSREYAMHALNIQTLSRDLQYQFKADSGLTSTLDDYQYLLQRSTGYRVMSFAFFDGTPSVNLRTVNESLQAAHVVNLLRN